MLKLFSIYRLSDVPKLLFLGFLYAVLARIVLISASANGNITTIWLPAGLGLAALLVYGKKYWLGVFIGSFAAGVMVDDPIWVSATLALGNALESYLGAWLLTYKSEFDLTLNRLQDYIRLIFLVGIITPIVSAIFGVTALLQAGYITGNEYFQSWLFWWLGDIFGIIILTPILLIWRQPPKLSFLRNCMGEAIILLSLAFLFGQIILCGLFSDTLAPYSEVFTLSIFGIWAALRFGRHYVSLILLIFLAQAGYGATHGIGYFNQDIIQSHLINFWLYFAQFSVLSLILALSINERKQAENVLDLSVAELKKTEATLLISEERLKLAVASGQFGIWDLNLQTQELIWDDNMFTLYGTHQKGCSETYDAWLTRLHPDDRVVAEAALQDAISGGKEYDTEFRVIWPDGDVHYIKGHASIVKDKAGNPVRMIGINWDSSAHAHTQQQLEMAYAAISNSKSAFIWLNSDGKVIDANDYAYQGNGYTRDEMIGQYIWLFDPDLPAKSWPKHWAEGKKKIIRTFESRCRRKDGTFFPIESTTNYMAINGQEYSFSFTRDITERKKYESELKIAASAFESQEGIMITDANNIIVRVNHAFTAITGYSAEDAIGKNPRLLSSGCQSKAFYEAMFYSINQTGVWQGEIRNRRKSGEIYPENLAIMAVKDDNGIITNYVATITDLSLSQAAADEIKNLAFYDMLTQLPNRRMLLDRLKIALASSARSGQRGALLFLDLDNFKTLNDTLGHDVGDLLLQQIAQRLTVCLRESDTAARLGGDEFVVLLEGLSDQDIGSAAQAEAAGYKILAALNEPYQLATHLYHSTSSIGITLFDSQQTGAEELLRQADIAMYQAKAAGRNGLRFFDPEMQEVINTRAAMESDLRTAIDEQQFQLYYQMQVDNTGQLLGAEALIRWHHPERGLVSPDQFIPLAEETGLILPIGRWVLDMACAQLEIWQKKVLTRDLSISINVSAKQFRQKDFVEQIQAKVLHHGINPSRLNLELTESMLLDNLEDTITRMKALNDVGIRFELDDFGTGYSSLQYLKNLPLYQLKIDQSFVHDIASNNSDQAIVRTIIAMAQSLGLEVIAEGVETEDQRKFLLDNGCMHYQGYLFGKPVPIDAFEVFLRKI
jgi:diguanylate cyclase (GGDEF)-like protein/PAS domain S-box-containing protein